MTIMFISMTTINTNDNDIIVILTKIIITTTIIVISITIFISGVQSFAQNSHFPVKATTRGLGTDLRYYEPTANATFRVAWRLEWNGKAFAQRSLVRRAAGRRLREANNELYMYIYIYIYIVEIPCIPYYYYYYYYYTLYRYILILLLLLLLLYPIPIHINYDFGCNENKLVIMIYNDNGNNK